MKRCNAILLIFILLLAPARPAAAEDIPLAEPPVDPSPIAITEVQTGSASGSDEFIELYNVSDQAVDISGWQLRYNNATTVGDGTILITELTSSD
ncbi:MAG TPA: lamin tail domain-containing protein, partial [Candidatus Saccharimonadales bacterium]|nr:lamin tail domain-containing protein [Candidatus Saccharimonadales bacterium]